MSMENLDNFENSTFNTYWDKGENAEIKMHSIHQYPAKFPAFIASKSFAFAGSQGVNIKCVGDLFCGCGTVALESMIHGYDFIGIDINPVAVLIAKSKSNIYCPQTLDEDFKKVTTWFYSHESDDNCFELNDARIVYWFPHTQIIELSHLKKAILSSTKGKYRTAFLCVFSSILKSCSRWLSKSIKPQIDPNKKSQDVLTSFAEHFHEFSLANDELIITMKHRKKGSILIQKKNVLSINYKNKVDLLISSPPYVTSYEYADIHQLSSLWLGFTSDYRKLRNGSIGSSYFCNDKDNMYSFLNQTGRNVVDQLKKNKVGHSKVSSVIRYYYDMQEAIKKSYDILHDNGMAIFVVGDTEFKGVKVKNGCHLYESMINAGFKDIRVCQRHISGKNLSPYRDKEGKFSSHCSDRQVYHAEFVIIGRKMCNGTI